MKVGIDSVEISRFVKLSKKHNFINKYFTDYERQYAIQVKASESRYSGIYAAKEAFLKALGLGIGRGIALNEVEIKHEECGRPYYHLSHNAHKAMKDKGFGCAELSITHTDSVATAICIIS